MLEQINSPHAPNANGPYSHAIRVGKFIFTSGQLPVHPESGKIESEDIREQTRQVLENLKHVLRAAGSDMNSVVKATVYLTDKKQYFGAMNEIYALYFPQRPARTTIEVGFIKELENQALIEMDVIAVAGS